MLTLPNTLRLLRVHSHEHSARVETSTTITINFNYPVTVLRFSTKGTLIDIILTLNKKIDKHRFQQILHLDHEKIQQIDTNCCCFIFSSETRLSGRNFLRFLPDWWINMQKMCVVKWCPLASIQLQVLSRTVKSMSISISRDMFAGYISTEIANS